MTVHSQKAGAKGPQLVVQNARVVVRDLRWARWSLMSLSIIFFYVILTIP